MTRHDAITWFSADGKQLTLDCDFPGGNILVDAVEGDEVTIHQDLRDTTTRWFYWAFRVRGAAGRTMRFTFTKGYVIGKRGPAVSFDGGLTWQWLGLEKVASVDGGVAFSFSFPDNADDVRFSFCIPYLQRNLDAFLYQYAGNPHIYQDTLCTTRKGRAVELLRVGNLDGSCRYRVLLTARHHCCESMANFEMEGILASMLADTEDGAWFRTHVECLAIPFVDKDGVEAGDQGKNRAPRDHNRDYDESSVHESVRVIMQKVPGWSAGRLRIALDLHCPDYPDQLIQLVGSRDPEMWQEQCVFSEMIIANLDGLFDYHSSDNLPYGTRWNVAADTVQGRTCTGWAKTLDGIRLASTIEFPYANVRSTTVTPENTRSFGAAVARAIRSYLEDGHREL